MTERFLMLFTIGLLTVFMAAYKLRAAYWRAKFEMERAVLLLTPEMEIPATNIEKMRRVVMILRGAAHEAKTSGRSNFNEGALVRGFPPPMPKPTD
jgi:hypothetical protein